MLWIYRWKNEPHFFYERFKKITKNTNHTGWGKKTFKRVCQFKNQMQSVRVISTEKQGRWDYWEAVIEVAYEILCLKRNKTAKKKCFTSLSCLRILLVKCLYGGIPTLGIRINTLDSTILTSTRRSEILTKNEIHIFKPTTNVLFIK